MKILAICYMGMNRSRHLAEYLKVKGYDCDFAGILTETKNLVTQERVDAADILIFVLPRIYEKFLWDFHVGEQRVIVLDVEDRMDVLMPEMTEFSAEEYQQARCRKNLSKPQWPPLVSPP